MSAIRARRTPTSMVALCSPDTTSSSRLILRTSDDSVSRACGQADVGLTLSVRAEYALSG